MHFPTPPGAAALPSQWLTKIILSVLLVFYSAWLFIIPPLQMPDEGAHMIKSCANLIVDKARRGYGHYFNGSFVDFSRQAQVTSVRSGSAPYSHATFFAEPVRVSEKQFFYPHAVPNTAVVYLLPHLACTTLYAADVPVQYIFYSQRIAIMLSFMAILLLAYRINPSFLLAASPLLMIPMVINQSVAISADYFSLAAVILFGALMCRPASKGKPEPWLFAFSVFLMLNVKVVYLPLLILALPPIIRFRLYLSAEHIWKTLVLALPALALQYYYQTAKTLGAWTSTRTTSQIDTVLAQPLDFLVILVNTLKSDHWGLVVGMLGNVGWLDTPMHIELVYVFCVSLLAYFTGLLFLHRKSLLRSLPLVASGLFGLISAFVLIFLAMYLFWSQPASDLVRGVQGRYLLPLLFFSVALIFQSRSYSNSNSDEKAMELPPALFALSTLAFFVNAALATWYLWVDVFPRYY